MALLIAFQRCPVFRNSRRSCSATSYGSRLRVYRIQMGGREAASAGRFGESPQRCHRPGRADQRRTNRILEIEGVVPFVGQIFGPYKSIPRRKSSQYSLSCEMPST